MSEKLYKKLEVVGTSDVSIEAAVNNAISGTAQTVRHLKWFEVDEIRGSISGDQVDQWQVGVKLGFVVDQASAAETPITKVEMGDVTPRVTPESENVG